MQEKVATVIREGKKSKSWWKRIICFFVALFVSGGIGLVVWQQSSTEFLNVPPPAPPGFVYNTVLESTFYIGGTIDTFDETRFVSVLNDLFEDATIEVYDTIPGSVIVMVRFVFQDMASVSLAKRKLQSERFLFPLHDEFNMERLPETTIYASNTISRILYNPPPSPRPSYPPIVKLIDPPNCPPPNPSPPPPFLSPAIPPPPSLPPMVPPPPSVPPAEPPSAPPACSLDCENEFRTCYLYHINDNVVPNLNSTESFARCVYEKENDPEKRVYQECNTTSYICVLSDLVIPPPPSLPPMVPPS